MSKWDRAAPVVEVEQEQEPIEAIAERTFKQLEERGWCLWRCEVLGGDVVVVVRDELVEGVPGGYPVYMSQELLDLLGMDDAMVRMVHEAKKLGGASIVGHN